MRIEIIIVGETTLSPDATITFVLDNPSVTQTTMKMKNKTIIIDFKDISGKTLPLSKALIPKQSLIPPKSYKVIATELKFLTSEDKSKFNEQKKPVEIRLSLTVFEQDTFLTHSEQNKKFQQKYEELRFNYLKTLENMQKEYSEKLEKASTPYDNTIDFLSKKIEDLSSSKLLMAINVKENLYQFISKAIDEKSDDLLSKEEIQEQLNQLKKIPENNKKKIDDVPTINFENLPKLTELESDKNDETSVSSNEFDS